PRRHSNAPSRSPTPPCTIGTPVPWRPWVGSCPCKPCPPPSSLTSRAGSPRASSASSTPPPCVASSTTRSPRRTQTHELGPARVVLCWHRPHRPHAPRPARGGDRRLHLVRLPLRAAPAARVRRLPQRHGRGHH